MEVSPRKLVQGWRIALFGTLLQILVSVGVVWLIGRLFDWSPARIVLLGFVISLSSTAVVPMLILLSLLGGTLPDTHTLVLQAVGAVFIIGLGG